MREFDFALKSVGALGILCLGPGSSRLPSPALPFLPEPRKSASTQLATLKAGARPTRLARGSCCLQSCGRRRVRGEATKLARGAESSSYLSETEIEVCLSLQSVCLSECLFVSLLLPLDNKLLVLLKIFFFSFILFSVSLFQFLLILTTSRSTSAPTSYFY